MKIFNFVFQNFVFLPFISTNENHLSQRWSRLKTFRNDLNVTKQTLFQAKRKSLDKFTLNGKVLNYTLSYHKLNGS